MHGECFITCRQRDRNALTDPLVRSSAVEVAEVLRQHAPEVPLAEDQRVVRALPADAAEEALADGVGPRRPDRRPKYGDAAGGGEAIELGAVLGVVVVDEEARSAPL